MSIVLQLLFNISISSLLFGLIAASFSLIYNVTKISHLAHGGVVLAAGYIMFWLMNLGVPLWLTVILTLLISTFLGFSLNALVYERLRKRQKISIVSSLIASIALLVLIQAVILALFKSRTKIIPLDIKSSLPLEIGGAFLTTWHLVIIGSSIIFLLALAFLLKKTKLGVAMRAVSDNEEVAEIIGINSKKIRSSAFVIGSFLAGVAGILAAVELNLDPNMGVIHAVTAFGRAVVGGIGSIPGALLGSFIIETGEHLGAWFWTSAYKQVISFILVFVFLIWRPQGILGRKQL